MTSGCFDHSAIWSRTKMWRRNRSSVDWASEIRSGRLAADIKRTPARFSRLRLRVRAPILPAADSFCNSRVERRVPGNDRLGGAQAVHRGADDAARVAGPFADRVEPFDP